MPAKNVAYCGLNCGMCPAYIATVKDSNEERAKVAELWTKEFGASFKAEDINCMGCKSEGPLFSHCSNCEIRSCASGKNMPNCGHCSDYACSKLDHIFKSMPVARDCLDAVQEACRNK
jgi:hypothetical protein